MGRSEVHLLVCGESNSSTTRIHALNGGAVCSGLDETCALSRRGRTMKKEKERRKQPKE